MAVLNSTVLERAWLEGSNDFQQRVPNPAVSGMAAAVDAIFDPYNNDLYNEFSQLLNGIMTTYVYNRRFDNPLRELKKPAKRFGNTERMVAAKYMRAHAFKYDDETLLKMERPEYREWFFSVNYKTRYEFTWSRTDMARAFSEDGYGFNELLQATLDAQISSDQYDEMNTMIQQFATADALWGLHRTNLTAAPTTEAAARELLVKIKSAAGRFKFPNVLYNAIDVPVFENPDTMILWVTPETDAYIDVMALAELFNVERAEVRFRKVVIPEFPIPDVYAALTSEDFVYMRDVEYGVYPFWNPGNLTDKYYLHHQAIVGANPAALCTLFTTGNATVIPTKTVAITGLQIDKKNAADALIAGGTIDLAVELEGTGADGIIALEPNAAVYTVAIARETDGKTAAVPVNSRTYVDERGTLHLQKSGIDTGDIVTVTATTKGAYVNPSGATEIFTDSVDITVAAFTGNGYKNEPVDAEPYIEYTDETDESDA